MYNCKDDVTDADDNEDSNTKSALTNVNYHDRGHTFDITGGPSPVFAAQEDYHYYFGHPYHPWANANKFWVTDLIFSKAQMSMSSADELIAGLRDGRLHIDGVRFNNSKSMYKILDATDYMPVST